MASLGSSSAPGPSYEERLADLQQAMDMLKLHLGEQDKLLQASIE